VVSGPLLRVGVSGADRRRGTLGCGCTAVIPPVGAVAHSPPLGSGSGRGRGAPRSRVGAVGGRRCPEGFRASSGSWIFGVRDPPRRPRFIPRLEWRHGWRAGGSRVPWALPALSARQGGSRSGGRSARRGPGAGGSVGVIRTPRADRALPAWSPVSGSGRPGGVHSLHGSSLGSHGAADPVSSFRLRGPL